MRQIAQVLSTGSPGKAMVAVARSAVCAQGCEGCSGCTHQEAEILAEALNLIGAQAGDTVEIETPTKTVLGFAALLYAMPPILMVAAYFAVPAAEWVKIAASVIGLAVGLGLCVVASTRLKQGKTGMPFIISVKRRENLH